MTKDEAAIRWLKRENERIWAMLGGQLASQIDFHANVGVEELDLTGDITAVTFRFPDDRAPGDADHVTYFQDGVLLRPGTDYVGGSTGYIKMTTSPGSGVIHCLWFKASEELVQSVGLARESRRRLWPPALHRRRN